MSSASHPNPRDPAAARFEEACAHGDVATADAIGRQTLEERHAVPVTPTGRSLFALLHWSALKVALQTSQVALGQNLKRPSNAKRIWADICDRSGMLGTRVIWAAFLWAGLALTVLSVLATVAAILGKPIGPGSAGGLVSSTVALVCVDDGVLLATVVPYINEAEFSVLGLGALLLFWSLGAVTAFHASVVARAVGAAALRLDPAVAARLILDSTPLQMDEMVSLDREFKSRGISKARRIGMLAVAFPELSMMWVLLVLLSTRIMSAADCGWYGYLVAFLLAYTATFTADVLFMFVEGLISAGLSRVGVDTTKTYLDEVLTTAATIAILSLFGLGILELILIGVSLGGALLGARAVKKWGPTSASRGKPAA